MTGLPRALQGEGHRLVSPAVACAQCEGPHGVLSRHREHSVLDGGPGAAAGEELQDQVGRGAERLVPGRVAAGGWEWGSWGAAGRGGRAGARAGTRQPQRALQCLQHASPAAEPAPRSWCPHRTRAAVRLTNAGRHLQPGGRAAQGRPAAHGGVHGPVLHLHGCSAVAAGAQRVGGG